jgi:hypothetical protein
VASDLEKQLVQLDELLGLLDAKALRGAQEALEHQITELSERFEVTRQALAQAQAQRKRLARARLLLNEPTQVNNTNGNPALDPEEHANEPEGAQALDETNQVNNTNGNPALDPEEHANEPEGAQALDETNQVNNTNGNTALDPEENANEPEGAQALTTAPFVAERRSNSERRQVEDRRSKS